MFDRFTFDRDKLNKDDKKEVYKRLEKTEADLGRELETDETPDMIALELECADGGEKKHWFMKTKELPLNDGYVKLADMLEATAKFPDVSLTEAVKKLKTEKKEK
ncbi:hypothetical protein C4565_06630 [Candidatus Parcubacteria bacterium]|jgi:hypothetical protein|nr:MAG: hypothetical protein C4565_06630 [Candidatus Parcubacteria bacterium]